MGRATTYPVQQADVWVKPKRRGYRIACCDCGLVHVVDFKLEPAMNGGKLIFVRFTRDNRKTAALRRERNKRA